MLLYWCINALYLSDLSPSPTITFGIEIMTAQWQKKDNSAVYYTFVYMIGTSQYRWKERLPLFNSGFSFLLLCFTVLFPGSAWTIYQALLKIPPNSFLLQLIQFLLSALYILYVLWWDAVFLICIAETLLVFAKIYIVQLSYWTLLLGAWAH